MKQIKILLSLLAICFAACGSDDTPEPKPPTPVDESERTVLIYLAAQNNLSAFADFDLKEMIRGSESLNDYQNLIVYVNIYGKKAPYFARIKDGKTIDSISAGNTASSDPASLEEAVRYMHEKYPAKSYGLVLWGHSNGWLIKNDSIKYAKTRSYGYDESSFPSTWMNIPSMARAIKNGMNDKKFTFIHGDCCIFGCVEVAYELRNVTDYVIGSPAEIPDAGANYADLSGLFDTSSSCYKSIIDKYWNLYIDEFKNYPSRYYLIKEGDLAGYSVPLMAVKTSELDNLAVATAKLLKTIPDKLEPTGIINVNNVIFYAADKGLKYNYDMFKTLKENTSETDFNEWESAFEKAVPYYRLSPRWHVGRSSRQTFIQSMPSFDEISEDCRVLSMFYPNNIYNTASPSWNKAIQQLQWNSPINWQQYGW